MCKKNSITPLKNGPLLLKNIDKLTDSISKTIPIEEESVALCRCDKSNNKPFCDGQHLSAKFRNNGIISNKT